MALCRYDFAFVQASTGETPWAIKLAMAADKVHPVPWVCVEWIRGADNVLVVLEDKNRSSQCAESSCPPFNKTDSHPKSSSFHARVFLS